MKISKVVGYVTNALAFALSDDSLFRAVRAVWLFGSAVRGELTAKSDIDVFFDCAEAEADGVSARAAAALGQFYGSRDFEKWKLLGIKNPISVQAGELRRWKLRTSVYAEGLLLFSKAAPPEEYESKTLFVIELPKGARYLALVRELFGRPEYKTPGIIQQVGGTKLSSNVFIVPREAFPKMRDTLVRRKVAFRVLEFLTIRG